MKKFRKKPIVIEAVQITEETFNTPHPSPEHLMGVTYDPVQKIVIISTLEGDMRGDIGDWIIKGVSGEFYPIKNDIFLETYSEVSEDEM